MTLAPLPSYPRSAYPELPAMLRKRTTAASRGWGAGWPNECPTKAQLTTPEIVRPRDGLVIGRPVRPQLAPLFGRLLTFAMLLDPAWELRTRDESSGGQGGTACRAIKKSNPPKPSNHSSGTAWDVNSSGNPMRVGKLGAAVAFISRQSPILIRLANAARIYNGLYYWDAVHRTTGNHHYVDSMHLEYMGRPEDVAGDLTALDAEYEAIRAELYPPEEPTVTPEQVKALQSALNAAGVRPPLVVDGVFGPLTAAAVESLPLTFAAHRREQMAQQQAFAGYMADVAALRLANARADAEFEQKHPSGGT